MVLVLGRAICDSRRSGARTSASGRARSRTRSAWTGIPKRAGGQARLSAAGPRRAGVTDSRASRKKFEARTRSSRRARAASIRTARGSRSNFPGLSMGIFSGSLRFTSYRGSNLLRMEAIAKTDEQSVAYKYRRRPERVLDRSHASCDVARSRRRSPAV